MMDDGEKAPTPKEDKSAGLFGLPSEGFKLGTTFKPANQEDKPDTEEEKLKNEPRPKGLFGADFGAALGDAQKEREKTPPQIKKEPEEEKPDLFGVPTVKREQDKPKLSPFGPIPITTPKPAFPFGKPSAIPSTLKPEPEPPQVTSKPEPSPSTTTAPSTESKASPKGSKDGSDDSHPLAGSEAEAVEIPESEEEDLSEEQGEENAIPLPPDPSTIKVSKDFYDVKLPGVRTTTAAVPLPPPPKVPSPPPQKQLTTESPLFGGKMSTTPAGFPKAPQMFAPPVPAVRESPRSPSPVRSASTPAGKVFSRPPSRPSSVRPQFTQSMQTHPPKPVEPVVTPASLQDKEAERNRSILESSIQPTLNLAKYITHQDYVGSKGEGKVSAQIETLFCDINSMVDTLGLNARALTEFVEGHNSLMPDNGRTKEDLERPEEDEGWCLVEVDDLITVERSLADEIDSERVEDKDSKTTELYAMRKELVRTKNKLKEVKRFLEQAKDEEKKEQRRKAPLDKATEAQQREIRRDMAKFLKVLVEAEEAVSMLKVKLASSGRQAAGQVPTVEAVEKTVKKMTQWAEEKGADMDVLEAQMKKLGLVGTGASSRPGSASKSMRASVNGGFRRPGVFSTPSPKKTPKKVGTFAVPEESDSESEAATDSFVDVDPLKEVVKEMVETRRRKAVIMRRVRDAIRSRGVRVTEA
jgi:nucleoporin NUP159